MIDDKRFVPEFGEKFWSQKQSIKKWQYCKHCYKETPCFYLREGKYKDHKPIQILLCCWECGSGLKEIKGETI